MKENPEKINRILSKLKQDTPGDWFPADGYHTIIQLSFTDGKANFHIDNGIPLKIFANRDTGEVRTYLLRDLSDSN